LKGKKAVEKKVQESGSQRGQSSLRENTLSCRRAGYLARGGIKRLWGERIHEGVWGDGGVGGVRKGETKGKGKEGYIDSGSWQQFRSQGKREIGSKTIEGGAGQDSSLRERGELNLEKPHKG